MTPQEQQWHWGEGTKYAIEGMKALLLLNGGAAIALLTFIGSHAPSGSNKTLIAQAIGNSLISFGVGTVSAATTFVAGYLTQLYYGNGSTSTAIRWHQLTYVLVIVCVAGFIAGVYFARSAVIASL
ncbi:hypothetical protein SAMN05444159_7587 [Bradyrhizobium lablabi]|uniref:Uncharacterized protein n=1 Tax=Bradyrhizobium lablabi TaxID=722472 RepID=A0A1M7FSU3_9BRAD|nr:hypothetical protein [Bradyrhizobium lablabi]SHM06858.1 hypothetical protein SAMN05444159_7587 [Bradyrhizobium lablabi]